MEALERGDIDVGFVRLPVDHPDLVTVPVLEERLVAAIRQGMPYRKGEPTLVRARIRARSDVRGKRATLIPRR